MSAGSFSLGAITATTQNLAQAQSSQAINSLESQSKNGDSKKIDKAAKDFESILLGEWLQKAEQSFASVPGTDPDQQNDSAYDQFQSISCQFLGEAMSQGGGIGIASMISKNLQAREAVQKTAETAKQAAAGPVSGTSQSR